MLQVPEGQAQKDDILELKDSTADLIIRIEQLEKLVKSFVDNEKPKVKKNAKS